MSLLVPSQRDYFDAHSAPEIEANYQSELAIVSQNEPHSFKWRFETVPGFFFQADPETDDLNFRYATQNLGRKMPWDQLMAGLAKLNQDAEPNVSYKLVICARHGQGYHNQVVDKYGGKAWDEKWHALGVDGDIHYGPDPMLTDLGLKQAQENNDAWKAEVLEHGAPIPSKFYCSPLQRSSWTHQITWDGIQPSDKKTMIVENIRETIGRNLCDKRSTRTVIEERFSKFSFECEPDFTENDILFTEARETDAEQAVRVNRFCQTLFNNDWDASANAVDPSKRLENAFISTTTHAGTIRLFIVVFGHRRFTISTGGMIPIVVKGTREL